MRKGLMAAILAVVVALGVGALLAGWNQANLHVIAPGNIGEGRAATDAGPVNPDQPIIRDATPDEDRR